MKKTMCLVLALIAVIGLMVPALTGCRDTAAVELVETDPPLAESPADEPEPAADPEPEPVEPTAAPVVEPTAAPVVESVAEPTEVPEPDPTAEPDPEPTAEPEDEPEPTEEPAPAEEPEEETGDGPILGAPVSISSDPGMEAAGLEDDTLEPTSTPEPEETAEPADTPEPEAEPSAAPESDTRTVRLTDFYNSEFGEATVTDGVLGELTTPTRTGWTFAGWYDGPITEKVDKTNPADEKTYWRWKVESSGKLVNTGETIGADVQTLYAMFKPTNITYKMNQNGWKNEFGALSCGREYGVPFTGIVYSWNANGNEWPGFVFDGWFTDPLGGVQIKDGDPVGEFKVVYAHWHKDGDPSFNQSYANQDEGYKVEKGLISAYEIDAPSKILHSVGDTMAIKAKLDPADALPKGLKWSSSADDVIRVDPVTPARGFSRAATLTALKEGEATITVTAENGTSASMTFKVGHDFSVLVFKRAATCKDQGWEQYRCSYPYCSKTETYYIDVLPHSYTKETVTPATCTSPAVRHQVCAVCGHTNDIEESVPIGHTFIEKEITICGVEGTVTEKVCTACGATQLPEGVTAAEHTWESGYTVDIEATCGAPGSESIHCAKCGAVKDSRAIPATGDHAWGAWVTVKKASYQETGLQERTCTVCGAKDSEVLPLVPNYPVGGGGGGGAAGGGGGGGAPAPEEPESTPEPTPEPSPEPEPTAEPEQAGGLQKAENGKTYLVIDGERATGVQTVNGVNYYFSAVDGHMLTGGIVNAGGGKKYYADETGELQTGIQQDSKGNTYYFSAKDGHMLKSGIVNAGGGKKYLASSTGTLLTGVQTVNGKTYYFSTKDGHMMKNGWVNAGNGVSYKLDKNGVVIETKGL